MNNTNRLEGCIVENYTLKESIKFCVCYVEGMEYIGSMHSINNAWDDEEGDIGHYGKALTSGTSIELDNTSLLQVHKWVLCNINEVQPWIE